MATVPEKNDVYVSAAAFPPDQAIDVEARELQEHEAHEVFKQDAGGVEFRTVSWPRATVIFLSMSSQEHVSVSPYLSRDNVSAHHKFPG